MDIDKLLEREIKQEIYREEYNKRPEVQERRRAYNRRKAEETKIARRVVKGELTRDQAIEMLSGLSTTEDSDE